MTHDKDDDNTIVYHMCLKARWEEALSSRKAYYPPTFQQDGNFTHATSVPLNVLVAANHFYKASSPPDEPWICVALSVPSLHDIGIVTVYEEAKAVGTTEALSRQHHSNSNNNTPEDVKTVTDEYPHVYGGIPAHIPSIVKHVYPMKRDHEGHFISIPGLTDG